MSKRKREPVKKSTTFSELVESVKTIGHPDQKGERMNLIGDFFEENQVNIIHAISLQESKRTNSQTLFGDFDDLLNDETKDSEIQQFLVDFFLDSPEELKQHAGSPEGLLAMSGAPVLQNLFDITIKSLNKDKHHHYKDLQFLIDPITSGYGPFSEDVIRFLYIPYSLTGQEIYTEDIWLPWVFDIDSHSKLSINFNKLERLFKFIKMSKKYNESSSEDRWKHIVTGANSDERVEKVLDSLHKKGGKKSKSYKKRKTNKKNKKIKRRTKKKNNK
jgi:hypothetical protein